jgi:hypothetical protein
MTLTVKIQNADHGGTAHKAKVAVLENGKVLPHEGGVLPPGEEMQVTIWGTRRIEVEEAE